MGYFKNILNNCVEASSLALKNEEIHISNKQKLEMKFHILFCKCCKNFVQQSSQIDISLKQHFQNLENNPYLKVSEEFKNRIKEKLR